MTKEKRAFKVSLDKNEEPTTETYQHIHRPFLPIVGLVADFQAPPDTHLSVPGKTLTDLFSVILCLTTTHSNALQRAGQ